MKKLFDFKQFDICLVFETKIDDSFQTRNLLLADTHVLT